MKKENLYFIALIPGRELREKISAVKHDFAARFKSKTALRVYPHITIKAPFKCKGSAHTELVNWFNGLRINQKAFTITLKDYGAFAHKKSPVIFINPVANDGLKYLQKELTASFSSLFPGDVHAVDINFHPHITVAYRDLDASMFELAWSEYKQKKFNETFDVSAFYLLQHDTKQWNIIATQNLL